MLAEAEQIKASRDYLKENQREKKAQNAAKASKGIDTTKHCREYGNQEI